MRTRLFFVALIASATAFASDTLDVKTGLWEITYTTATHGTLIPQSTLDKLTPEQRAKLQASMKAQQAAGPKAHTDQTCVTEEDLKKGAFRDEDDDTVQIHLSDTHQDRSRGIGAMFRRRGASWYVQGRSTRPGAHRRPIQSGAERGWRGRSNDRKVACCELPGRHGRLSCHRLQSDTENRCHTPQDAR